MNLEEINAHLELDYPTTVLVGVFTWLMSNYVRTYYPHRETEFPKHTVEEILRSSVLSNIMEWDYIKQDDLNILASALFGHDEHGYFYAKSKHIPSTMNAIHFPANAYLDFKHTVFNSNNYIQLEEHNNNFEI